MADPSLHNLLDEAKKDSLWDVYFINAYTYSDVYNFLLSIGYNRINPELFSKIEKEISDANLLEMHEH